MFERTRRRLGVQFALIIGAMLLLLLGLFYVLLHTVADRSELAPLKDASVRTLQEYRHHQNDDRRQPRPDASDGDRQTMDWDFLDPHQFVVAADPNGKPLAHSVMDPSQLSVMTTAISGGSWKAGDTRSMTIRLSTGSERLYRVEAFFYPDASGKMPIYTYAGVDITERQALLKQTGLLLLALAAVLLIASSIAGYVLAGRAMIPISRAFRRQQQFTADASHELRTPLSVMQSSVEILEEQAESLPAFHRGVLEGMRDEISRMSKMTGQLLTLARGDERQLAADTATFDFAQTAQLAVGIMAPYAMKREVRLTLQTEAETLPFVGDEEKLKQVLYILLDNAIKYTQSGGQVELRLSRAEPGGRKEGQPSGRTDGRAGRRVGGKASRGAGEQSGGNRMPESEMESGPELGPAGASAGQADRQAAGGLLLIVRDTGIGIPAEDLPHIFERFYRVNKARSREEGGTGLGLSIAAEIVRSHGGLIEAASEPGVGSTFTVTLPGGKTR